MAAAIARLRAAATTEEREEALGVLEKEATAAAVREADITAKHAKLQSAFRAQVELVQCTRDDMAAVAAKAAEEAGKKLADSEARVKRREVRIQQLMQQHAAVALQYEKTKERADAAEKQLGEHKERAEAADAQLRTAAADGARVRESSAAFVAAINKSIENQIRQYEDLTAVLAACSAMLSPLISRQRSTASPASPPASVRESPCPFK